MNGTVPPGQDACSPFAGGGPAGPGRDRPARAGKAPAGPWTYRRLWLPELAVLLGLAAVTAVVFSVTDLDLAITRIFYFAWRRKPFFLHLDFPWRLLYVYVAVPVAATALGAFALLAASYRSARWRRYRVHGLFVLLSLALGPGFLVNGLLKEHWGRPRPRHVQAFGGRRAYRQALEPGGSGAGKSFPCGHSSAGYFFTTFYFLFRRKRRGLARLSLAFAALFGTALGYGRLLSGSHFASDVLWSAYAVTLVSWALYYFGLNVPGREDAGVEALAPPGSPAVVWRGAALAAAIVVASLFATPYYADLLYELPLPGPARPAEVDVAFDRGDVDLVFTGDRPSVHIEGLADGFGLVGSKLTRWREVLPDADPPVASFRAARRGWFTELNVQVTVSVPDDAVRRVRIRLGRGNLNVQGPEAMAGVVDLEVARGTLTLPASWKALGPAARAPSVVYEDPPPRPAR